MKERGNKYPGIRQIGASAWGVTSLGPRTNDEIILIKKIPNVKPEGNATKNAIPNNGWYA